MGSPMLPLVTSPKLSDATTLFMLDDYGGGALNRVLWEGKLAIRAKQHVSTGRVFAFDSPELSACAADCRSIGDSGRRRVKSSRVTN